MMASRAPVGIIGLGLLGEALALRLLRASFGVIGYDIDPARIDELAGIGGKPAKSIAEVARAASRIVLAVFDTDQVEAVVERDLVGHWAEKGGEKAREAGGRIVLCAATCDPDRIAALAARVAPHGIRFLETPVVGSSAQIAAGDSLALLGGDPGVIVEADDILEAMFPVRSRVGTIGDGGRTKLALNLILGLNRQALAEGLVFAERVGLDPKAFLKVARRSAAYSRVMDNKGPKMVSGDFSPEAHARQHLKDVRLMLAKADEVGQELPTVRLHAELLEACMRAGEGELDNSVIFAELRRRGRDRARSEREPRRRQTSGRKP